MRIALMLPLVLAACGARSSASSTPVRYACADATFTRAGSEVTSSLGSAELGWSDAEGDHFVYWSTRQNEYVVVEIVAPLDPRKDATRNIYSKGTSGAMSQWPVLSQQQCTAAGGYYDVLAHWMEGRSFQQVATDLQLESTAEAKYLARQALTMLQRRYVRER